MAFARHVALAGQILGDQNIARAETPQDVSVRVMGSLRCRDFCLSPGFYEKDSAQRQTET